MLSLCKKKTTDANSELEVHSGSSKRKSRLLDKLRGTKKTGRTVDQNPEIFAPKPQKIFRKIASVLWVPRNVTLNRIGKE